MVVSRLNDAILMVREMVKQRFEPMGIISPGSPGMYEQQFSTALGKYAEYCITNVPWFNPTQPMTAELRKRFTKAYPDETFELNVGFTFEAILIAADAAKRAGGVQSEALVEALRTTDIKEHVMTGGPIKFSEEGQNVDIVSAAVQNRNGGMAVVLPADIATEKPVFPMPKWKDRG
jgi:branched-chain amino acid transport system substrate-binding protein